MRTLHRLGPLHKPGYIVPMTTPQHLPLLVIPLLVVAACGGDKGSTGPTGSFNCQGQPLPTTATNPVVVTGLIRANVLTPAPLAGATVKGFKTGVATALDSTTSDSVGNYSLTLATASVPLDGYVLVSKTGYVDTYGYPPAPLAASAAQSVLLVTSSEVVGLYAAAGSSHTGGTGSIAVVITDCDGTPIAGATVSTSAGGTVRYSSGSGIPSSSATSTSADGVAYVLNVTAGDVVVSGALTGHTLRSHTVNARADVVTITGLAPGPLN